MTRIHSGEGVTEARSVPGWNDYFLDLADAAARRSRDPNTQVGAVIADAHNHIISTGYNGPPPGLNDRALDWSKGDRGGGTGQGGLSGQPDSQCGRGGA